MHYSHNLGQLQSYLWVGGPIIIIIITSVTLIVSISSIVMVLILIKGVISMIVTIKNVGSMEIEDAVL